jgi:hypothetical protein
VRAHKVTRLLRLADSPEVVEEGMRDGLASDGDGKKGGGEADAGDSEHRRALDLMPALEFTRLHEFFSRKHGKGKNEASSADEKTR